MGRMWMIDLYLLSFIFYLLDGLLLMVRVVISMEGIDHQGGHHLHITVMNDSSHVVDHDER
jgi:hypothetical protein